MSARPDDQATRPNIILTGFMGTGKTVVGRAVAERLGRFFIDMDEVIERRTGKPISAVFAEDGEVAFRTMEAELCQELAAEQNIVIATGGGALVRKANRDALERTGVVICLSARPEDILQRVQMPADRSESPDVNGPLDRPLLAGPDRQQRIVGLLKQRAAAYDAIPHQIHTSGLTVAEVAEQVIRIYRQQVASIVRIPVRYPGASGFAGGYSIVVGEGLLLEAGGLMVEAGLKPNCCAVVTNPNVGVAHAAFLLQGLEEAGFEPHLIDIPDGEIHKTLATVTRLYDRFLEAGLDRRSPVVALGGGVVGDVAGYAAATYLRGIPLVQVPTSLLAMVDASVGGKTGVDLPQGKNLVGAFKQPALVVIDPEVMKTLPAVEFRSGLAEVVKHGIIGAPGLFESLEGVTPPLPLAELVATAVRVKVDVVEEDPFEQGRRAVLNLGHTFAHALEVLSNYQLRHGEAVSIGLAASTRLAARLAVCDPALVLRVEHLLSHLDLPSRYAGPTPNQVVAAMAADKKRVGTRLRFVLPRALGDVDVFDEVPLDQVTAVLGEIAQ